MGASWAGESDAWEPAHRLDLVGQENDRNERVIHNRSRLLGKENNALDNWVPGTHNNAKIKFLQRLLKCSNCIIYQCLRAL
jgi:hypothetical protein